MALVGTECDLLLDDLNELKRMRLNGEEGNRIKNLRTYLAETNRGGGSDFTSNQEICDRTFFGSEFFRF